MIVKYGLRFKALIWPNLRLCLAVVSKNLKICKKPRFLAALGGSGGQSCSSSGSSSHSCRCGTLLY